jgi:predicted kinase
VPRLIVLNGPPAVGKSTIAQRFVDDHPLALTLELDRLRRMLGGWRADPLAAGRLARPLALAAARTHLEAGYDVVLPQYLGQVDFLAQLAALAAATDATLHEVVLMASKDRILARFAARTRAAVEPEHVDAQQILDANGGPLQLEAMYDRLLLVIAARPDVKVVGAPDGEIEATYRDVRAVTG